MFMLLGVFLAATLLVGCASTSSSKRGSAGEDDFTLDDDEYYDETPVVNDPFEDYNRFVFNFNHKLYEYVFTPLSKGYDFLVPKKVQGSIHNFMAFSASGLISSPIVM